MSRQSGPEESFHVVEVEGARLRCRVEGDGPPCLVVGSSIYYPRVFSQELRERLRLVFVDLRQFAITDPSFPPGRVSMETFAADIERVRDTLSLRDVVVIGHSIHGTIALEYARRRPKHVRGVVAIGAPPGRSEDDFAATDRLWESEASEERKQIAARRLAALANGSGAGLSAAETFVRSFVADGARHWYAPTYDSSWLWEGVVPDMRLMDRVYGQLFKDYDLAQGPTAITVPVLIVHGRYDYIVAYTLWEQRRQSLPRHSFSLFERSGHTPPLEEPERFDRTLLAWVEGLPSAGSGA